MGNNSTDSDIKNWAWNYVSRLMNPKEGLSFESAVRLAEDAANAGIRYQKGEQEEIKPTKEEKPKLTCLKCGGEMVIVCFTWACSRCFMQINDMDKWYENESKYMPKDSAK